MTTENAAAPAGEAGHHEEKNIAAEADPRASDPDEPAVIYISGVCIGEDPNNVRGDEVNPLPDNEEDDDEDPAVIYIAGACTYPRTRDQSTNTSTVEKGVGQSTYKSGDNRNTDCNDTIPQPSAEESVQRAEENYETIYDRYVYARRDNTSAPTINTHTQIKEENWEATYDRFYSHPVDTVEQAVSTAPTTSPVYTPISPPRDNPIATQRRDAAWLLNETPPTTSSDEQQFGHSSDTSTTYTPLPAYQPNLCRPLTNIHRNPFRREYNPYPQRECFTPHQCFNSIRSQEIRGRDYYSDIDGTRLDTAVYENPWGFGYNSAKEQYRNWSNQDISTRINEVTHQIGDLNRELNVLRGLTPRKEYKRMSVRCRVKPPRW